MNLQPAAASDLPEIVELTNLAFRGEVGWTLESKYIEGERISLKTLHEDLANRPQALLMISRNQDEILLGSVWLEPKKDGVWYMGLLAVRPDLQGQQLGRRMLDASEDAIRQRGAKRIRISVVNVRQNLVAWYERRGYAQTGEREPFPYGDDRVGRPLRDDLEFVMLEKEL
ncbi:GNAT family N-acetyltransferase [Edaphobacter modestus]|uniref:Ribosomal protein S18 acetylase RimI-like enzyme n=1 Tax=Edaphobacter modestus TaxID=388466 RepID=A0A4Q7YSK8_9BACT|nr:GNAT family N-acetyltransferase [Edaphobacter modestus]RZU39889.1 ribosomal protein S18 acetylase RimI-like enzyme [Edaphobacter modestus]